MCGSHGFDDQRGGRLARDPYAGEERDAGAFAAEDREGFSGVEGAQGQLDPLVRLRSHIGEFAGGPAVFVVESSLAGTFVAEKDLDPVVGEYVGGELDLDPPLGQPVVRASLIGLGAVREEDFGGRCG